MASASFFVNAGSSSRPVATSAAQSRRSAHPQAIGRVSTATAQPLLSVLSTSSSTGGWSQESRNWRTRQHVIAAAEPSGSEGPSSLSSLKETAALDDLIDKLLQSRSQQEMARLVAENIFSIDNKFWLRVATRNDTASSSEEKERLKSMADSVMILVQTVMKRTEQQLADSSRILQEIMTAAADENGEWYLPLTPEQVSKLRDSLDNNAAALDEALLSNAFAWMRKCSEDRFDTMVTLIQKVLQLYAARALKGPETTGVEGVLNQVVYAEESEWSGLIKKAASEGAVSEPDFMEALQRRMESTVLGLQSGSYAQRVQAEYLKEIESRARQVFKELAESRA